MSSTPAAPALKTALQELIGDAVAPADAAHAIDGLAPRFVATPESVDELAAVLSACDARGAAVVLWGGGRHMGLGSVPQRYDVALRTGMLDGVIEHEPADLTITVGAGITMGRLQEMLAEHGQFLPIDAPVNATVGGVLAAGVSGPSRHAYGLPRDWLIGCRIVQADGAIVRGGGRVVKNVAGYDLPKLFVGSLGTLGAIAEATFKVAPLPPAQETLLVRCASIEEAAALVTEADQRSLALRAVAMLVREGAVRVALWLSGAGSAVERTARELRELATGEIERLEGQASDAWWADHVEEQAAGVELRTSLPPSAVADFAARCRDEVVAYPAGGVVLARRAITAPDELVDEVTRLRALATASGGSLVVVRAPTEVKRRIDVWGESDALPLMQRLKQQFDPNDTLNPGRFVGGL